MIWSTTLQAVSNAFSQACLSIQLPSFLSSADWHEGAASVELGLTSLVIWNMSWMHYLRKLFSFDAFSVLVLVLIVCMWLESGSHVIAMQTWIYKCMELSSSSHWGLFLHVVLIADITCCGCGTPWAEKRTFSYCKIDKVNRSRFPSDGKCTIVDRNPYVGGCSFHAAGHITHEHPG